MISCNRVIYGQSENANAAAPASQNFALRARLIEFDTENSIPTARGWVAYRLLQDGEEGLNAKIA